ncbi:MAG: hypothetical protein ABI743_11445, partial [bacterium]
IAISGGSGSAPPIKDIKVLNATSEELARWIIDAPANYGTSSLHAKTPKFELDFTQKYTVGFDGLGSMQIRQTVTTKQSNQEIAHKSAIASTVRLSDIDLTGIVVEQIYLDDAIYGFLKATAAISPEQVTALRYTEPAWFASSSDGHKIAQWAVKLRTAGGRPVIQTDIFPATEGGAPSTTPSPAPPQTATQFVFTSEEAARKAAEVLTQMVKKMMGG